MSATSCAHDSRLCIAQKLNCDSEANCYDGSDEWDCNDSAANLFWDSFYRKNIKAITDDIPWGTCCEHLLNCEPRSRRTS